MRHSHLLIRFNAVGKPMSLSTCSFEGNEIGGRVQSFSYEDHVRACVYNDSFPYLTLS